MDNIIQGNPTKLFFIEMITRDISIKDAILDLLDNSIDGANRLNNENYEGLFINITINKNEFIVEDNCGGFSLEIARKYAFRFGRPDDAPKTYGSVGRFGIGMKRALFKIGHKFEVESKTNEDHFQIDVDVEQWKEKKKKIKLENDDISEEEDWSFTYKNINPQTNNLAYSGTYIRVDKLNPEVADTFNDDNFLNNLKSEIERLLNFSLEKNIQITLNGANLKMKSIVLFNGKSKPYFHQGTYENVDYKIYAGLSHVGDPSSSGWYIYCNDRLVVEADQSEVTGWGIGKYIPQFHTNFVMFKGVVFLDSKETINLPLTTTKKGIDTTSEIYRKVFFFMKEALIDVLGFLKQIPKLKNEANEYRKILGENENKITVTELKDMVLDIPRKFVRPDLNIETISSKNDWSRVAFYAWKEHAELAKKHSGTTSYPNLGKYIFNYYLKMEELIEEDE
jgi:hypothetical protein